jgi:hypothetical protein
MKIQRLLAALTLLNFGILIFVLTQMRPLEANGVAPVLRGRALQIVDDHGKVRASIQVLPAGPARRADGSLSEADGKTYPETVLLRLIDPNGRPGVKLGASEQGAGLGLGGESDPTYIVLKAEGADTSLKLTNKDGRQQLIKP